MKIINDLYTPDICLLCIGDFYTMGPKEAAYALNNVSLLLEVDAQLLTNCKIAIPMHFKTFGLLTGTPTELKSLVTREDCQIHELVPGKEFKLSSVCCTISCRNRILSLCPLFNMQVALWCDDINMKNAY